MVLYYILWWLAIGGISTTYFLFKDDGMLEKIVNRLCVDYGLPEKRNLIKLGVIIFLVLVGGYVLMFNEIKFRVGLLFRRIGRKIRERRFKINYIKNHPNIPKNEAEINALFIIFRCSSIRLIRQDKKLKPFYDWLDGE